MARNRVQSVTTDDSEAAVKAEQEAIAASREAPKLTRVRTGKTSYLNLNDDDLEAWKAAGNTEYGEADDTGVDLNQEQANQDQGGTKAESAPAENKARTAAPEKKQG